MRLFDGTFYMIRRALRALGKKPSDLIAGSQLRPNDGQGPFTSFFNSFLPRKVEGSFYEFLREAIPIIDAAINRLVNLDGHIEITGENEALVDEIQEWFYNVRVNDVQKGVQAFHQSFTSEAFEQGFAVGEFIADRKRTDIVGLRVGDSKYISFKRTPSGIEIYQKADGDREPRSLDPSNLLYFSINNENQNPYGVPLMRSCEFVSKILATMQNSLLNVWERFGDPSFHVHYTASNPSIDKTLLDDRRQKIETDFNTTLSAKRSGKSADFITAGGKDSSVVITVIGGDGQVLEIENPARHVQEQIIAKTGLPAWMLGMHWSTTERLSDAEVEILLADVNTRQAAKLPLFYNLIRTLLLLRGRTWKKGDWKLEWAQVNLRDVLKQAQARFMNTQADLYEVQNAQAGNNSTGKTAKGVQSSKFKVLTLGTSHIGHGTLNGSKEQRPFPNPELDKLEDEYLKELVFEWGELKERTFLILKLSENKGSSDLSTKNPLDPFVFSEEQRAMILKSMREWIGAFDIAEEDSPVTWYYGQTYSLGLIQAAHFIGKERPILDILKNREIFGELSKNGFQLVKENATKAITEKILPAIDAHVIAGSNPLQIAGVLEKLFGDKNSDWERLARSELSMAAEQAKLDEWKAWKISRVEYATAPDACPICMALAGIYEIGKCPLPVRDTHPRCRCSIRPAEEA